MVNAGSELTGITAHEAQDLLSSGQVSSVELTEAVLKRVEEIEPQVHSYITVTQDRALDAARAADEARADGKAEGPLAGIPVMVKDNLSTEGVATTAGSRMLLGYTPPYDAYVVEQFRSGGAVIVGKGNLDEFAMGSSTEHSAFGATRNPWDTDRVPGGSSGGPAAGVAANECFVSLGSDTGGSIRQPAALCGIVGMKPTYGLVSRYGLIAFGSSLDQIGPFSRDVRDAADTLSVISGHDKRDSTSLDTPAQDFTSSLTGDISGMKLGVPREYLVDGMESGVKAAFEKSLETLEGLGATLEEVSLPLTDQALAVYYIIAPSEASANLARYDGFKYGNAVNDVPTAWDVMDQTREQGFGAEVKRRILIGAYALSAGYYDAYYKKAQQVRTLIRQEFAATFENFDALVTPTSPTVAFKAGDRMDDPVAMYLSDVCTIPVNIAGLPAISVPGGISEDLPVGLQFIGPQMGDGTVLRVAHAYEQATEWHRLKPGI
ncbi:MAG: Asp-tRNA(Asn)/Glu-tRNA(Gln) amidotransferase subunit GatA [Chloroflexi bacterium]|nr:Asp-tRNA(Asn)/Glu-tRNA(Gln) amidotransferase subunit GatA [Chloroflexota bacterium]MBT4073869.1 Asp-tRNA(Asn)/Glu-tRNA(Gln) amidotransferase subunit GatA [Chloroflexota bacterium]MBT4513531.1 Asp-tRNA(Asn)/Glu-tRNA(Gln) amidotransferase subunit GatA [Chloroflexota bacterium]MBT6681760.1 Asp-tRNA(Asn)/Glu-tRNA(Gln) amidotransferase subunit GatA [Chloroflexota bacterium]